MLNNHFDSDAAGQRLEVERRDILKMGLGTLLASVVPFIPVKSAFARNRDRFSAWNISFRHAHTGESFSGAYRVGDRYLPEAFERMNYILRDYRMDEVFPMDPRIIDILALIHERADATEPYQILSGYRSPRTNAMLRHSSVGVAKNSYHMYGQAIDIRVPGKSTKALRNVALSLRAGGVGYYPRSSFVHVDTGKVRSW